MFTTKLLGSVSTSIHSPGPGEHLQSARDVFSIQDRECAVIRVRTGTQLARLWIRVLLGIEIEPNRRDMLVDLVIEEMLILVQGERRETHHQIDDFLHLGIISLGCLGETGRRARPEVRNKITLPLPSRIVGFVRPACSAM